MYIFFIFLVYKRDDKLQKRIADFKAESESPSTVPELNARVQITGQWLKDDPHRVITTRAKTQNSQTYPANDHSSVRNKLVGLSNSSLNFANDNQQAKEVGTTWTTRTKGMNFSF